MALKAVVVVGRVLGPRAPRSEGEEADGPPALEDDDEGLGLEGLEELEESARTLRVGRVGLGLGS